MNRMSGSVLQKAAEKYFHETDDLLENMALMNINTANDGRQNN